MQRNLEWQKADRLIPGRKGVGQEGAGGRECEETFGGDGCIHYVDGSDGFMGVYLCQNI